MAVVVTIAKGYDLGYIWKTQDHAAERAIGGYYINAAQDGEPPGRWWGPGAQALGLALPRSTSRRGMPGGRCQASGEAGVNDQPESDIKGPRVSGAVSDR